MSAVDSARVEATAPVAERSLWAGLVAARWAPHVAVLATFTLLTVIATWPMFPQLGGYVIDKGDPLYSVWAMAWQAHAFVTNPLGLFDANIMYPFRGTLAFDELSFSEAVLAAPVYYLTGNPVLSHNLLLFLTFVLSGYTMWLLVRDLTGSGWAGLVAGTVFAFSFYRLNHLPHMTLINTQWMPLLLLAGYKLLWRRRWRWAWALAGLFAMQALAGHYLAFYSAMLLAIFFAFYWIADRALFSWRLVGMIAVTMLAALVVMLPVLVPFVYYQQGYEFKRSLFEVERFSNTLSSFLAVYRGNPILRSLLAPFADPGPWFIERAAFPGFFTVALALVAVFWRRRKRDAGQSGRAVEPLPHERYGGLRRHALFYGLLVLLTALLSLGPSLQISYASNNYDPNAINRVMPLPYLLLHEFVPGFQSMRVVARIDVLTALSLSALAGIGAFYLLRWAGSRWASLAGRRRALALSGAAILLALLPVAESWSAPVTMAAVGTRDAVPQVYRWLAQQPPTVFVEYPMVYYKTGDPNVEMANLYQYYTAYHWQRTINASTTIRPYAYSAMVLETEDCFPCPRSLDALYALDVRYVVVHLENLSGPQRTDFEWRATDPAGKVVEGFVKVADFGSDRVYRIEPRDVTRIKDVIPAGESVLLGSPNDDPLAPSGAENVLAGGYMAALGWVLRDHPQYGDSRLSFGQTIHTPDISSPARYAVLWSGQDPRQSGFHKEDAVWSNEHVTVYRYSAGLGAVRNKR